MSLLFVPVRGARMGGSTQFKHEPVVAGDFAQLEIPATLFAALQAEARRTRRSMSKLIAESVSRFLEDEEDRKDIAAAKKKGATPIPLAQVKKTLGLAD